MTSHHETDAYDPTTDPWLAQQRAMMNDLDAVLDVKAGLHEVLLQSRPDAMVDNLDTVLDVEAGLHEVLSTAPPGPRPPAHPNTAATDSSLAQQLLESVGAEARMQLRAHPDVARSHRRLDHVRTLDRIVTHSLERIRALTHGLEDARDLASTRDLVVVIAHDLEDAHDLITRDLTRDLTHGLIVNDLAPSLTADLARPHARALARALDVAHGLALRLAHDLDNDRNVVARTVAINLSLDLDRALGLILNLVDIWTKGVKKTLSEMLGRDLSALDMNLVDRFLHDFTTSNLRNADLRGISLDGVRWSMTGTQWPPDVDVEALKSRSVETPAGSGTWTVRPGTTMAEEPTTIQ